MVYEITAEISHSKSLFWFLQWSGPRRRLHETKLVSLENVRVNNEVTDDSGAGTNLNVRGAGRSCAEPEIFVVPLHFFWF